MSVRTYLVGLALSSALCSVALVLTLVNTNPGQGGQTALASLYVSAFFSLLGIITLIGYSVRRYLSRNEVKYAHIQASFRQGFLVSALAVGLLLLQAIRLVSWWDILLLLLIVVLIELYLRANARSADLR